VNYQLPAMLIQNRDEIISQYSRTLMQKRSWSCHNIMQKRSWSCHNISRAWPCEYLQHALLIGGISGPPSWALQRHPPIPPYPPPLVILPKRKWKKNPRRWSRRRSNHFFYQNILSFSKSCVVVVIYNYKFLFFKKLQCFVIGTANCLRCCLCRITVELYITLMSKQYNLYSKYNI
jgi:hypothetical protein